MKMKKKSSKNYSVDNRAVQKTFFDLFASHRKGIAVAILIGIIAILILFFFKSKLSYVDEKSSRIELILFLSSILANLFVIAGAFVAVSQYYISSRGEIINRDMDKVKRAIDLCEFYNKEVLGPYSMIKTVFKKIGIIEIMQTAKNKMEKFNYEELENIFSAGQISELERLFSSREYTAAIVEVSEMFRLDLCGISHNKNSARGLRRSESIAVDPEALKTDFAVNYIAKIMNNAEIFAMYFAYDVADESIVFSTIYPSYLEMCRTLYYNIAICSQCGKPKLYRNLQKLYCLWNKKLKDYQDSDNRE